MKDQSIDALKAKLMRTEGQLAYFPQLSSNPTAFLTAIIETTTAVPDHIQIVPGINSWMLYIGFQGTEISVYGMSLIDNHYITVYGFPSLQEAEQVGQKLLDILEVEWRESDPFPEDYLAHS
ncbi:MAG: hypothetical protein ACE5OZ_11485 [Candidatus Heimdallarchaeota archaeon]